LRGTGATLTFLSIEDSPQQAIGNPLQPPAKQEQADIEKNNP
jgi:hypothetical protein